MSKTTNKNHRKQGRVTQFEIDTIRDLAATGYSYHKIGNIVCRDARIVSFIIRNNITTVDEYKAMNAKGVYANTTIKSTAGTLNGPDPWDEPQPEQKPELVLMQNPNPDQGSASVEDTLVKLGVTLMAVTFGLRDMANMLMGFKEGDNEPVHD